MDNHLETEKKKVENLILEGLVCCLGVFFLMWY